MAEISSAVRAVQLWVLVALLLAPDDVVLAEAGPEAPDEVALAEADAEA